MRPRGSYGDVALALISAAERQPGTVSELAERACVGYDAARRTASRLRAAGDLLVLDGGRPAVLAAPSLVPGGESLGDALQQLHRSFWESGPAVMDVEAAP